MITTRPILKTRQEAYLASRITAMDIYTYNSDSLPADSVTYQADTRPLLGDFTLVNLPKGFVTDSYEAAQYALYLELIKIYKIA